MAEPGEDDATLAQSLFQRIGEAIIRGEMPLGSKISEPVLARRYRVSRGPLREALNRLQERRLIDRAPRLGARVVTLSGESLRQLYGVREALEGMAARGAAGAVTPTQLDELRRLLDAQEAGLDASGDDAPNAMGRADEDFHALIARAGGNALLARLLCDDLRDQLRLYRSQLRRVPGRGRRALLEHRRVLDAIAEGDAEMAELQMRRHVAASFAALEHRLDPAPPAPRPAGRGRRHNPEEPAR